MGQAAGRLSAEAMLDAARAARPARSDGRQHRRRRRGGRSDERRVGRAVRRRTRSSPSAARRTGSPTRSRRSCPSGIASGSCSRSPRRKSSASELGEDQSFSELWGSVEGMLTSYSDESFVSTEYGARAVERPDARGRRSKGTSDDPPERVTAWLTTVSDGALRGLDHHLLLDLLVIEADPLRWRDIAQTVVTHADDLVRVGYFDQALAARRGGRRSGGAPAPSGSRTARAALEQFGRGVDDEARDRVPPQHRRRRLRAVQAAVPRDGDRGDHAARRGPVERTGRAVAPAAARHPDRVRRAGTRVGAAADELAQLGGPPDGRVPAARVRRHRRTEGAHPAPDRHRAAGPARGDPGAGAQRQRRSVGRS